MSKSQVVAIILAGGTGRRMESPEPKQFLRLGGKPILSHTLQRFEDCPAIDAIVLVAHPAHVQRCRREIVEPVGLRKIRRIVEGGGERHESVKAGLLATTDRDALVVVHDAVRPLVSDELLVRVIQAGLAHGAATAAIGINDTVKHVDRGKVISTIPRDSLRRAQTPQAFRLSLLLEAHNRKSAPENEPATDDAALIEQLGHEVVLVESGEANLKITSPEDLAMAEWYMQAKKDSHTMNRARIGQGVDVHAFAAGRDLVLGGVQIPFALGLAGHSDADVLTHAIIDALLGASGLGDIGHLFPDTDQQYKDISSLILLEQVKARLDERGVRICNIDAVVMAEAPKLAPHIEKISQTLASTLQIDRGLVSVKATTTEALGFVGRREGIMAQAVALVESEL